MSSVDTLHGALIVDKPVGITSHDVIARLRKMSGQRRIGHTGTLDPLASGVMVVLFGRGAKLSQFLVGESKTYVADIFLGRRSKTYDAEGVFPSENDITRPEISRERLDDALKEFVGVIEQRPPIYSAVKVNGRRLYKAARQGEEPLAPLRTVRIDDITVDSFDSPDLRLVVDCGSGVYIRSLANDLGEKLGCGGYLSGLRRIRVGGWTIDSAHTLAELELLAERGELTEELIAPKDTISLPSLVVADEFTPRLLNGVVAGPQNLAGVIGEFETGERVSLVNEQGKLLAVGVSEAPSSEILTLGDKQAYRYLRVM